MGAPARLYLNGVVILGGAICIASIAQWQSTNPGQFAAYLLLAAAAATRKVKLPGITGTYSLSFLFVLLGISELSLAETITIGCVAAFVQSVWKASVRPTMLQVLFNMGNMVISIASAYAAAQMTTQLRVSSNVELTPLTASVYFVVNTLLVSCAIAIVNRQEFRSVWAEWMLWSVPYYVVGALVTMVMSAASKHQSWQLSLAALPLMYLASVCYTFCISRFKS